MMIKQEDGTRIPGTELANVDESCDIALITPPPIGERSIVMNMSVCLYVCVCMR